MSDSLTATKVETNQCPSHQSILLTQGRPIHEIFNKKYWELAELENELVVSFSWKQVKVYRIARIFRNFDAQISSPKQHLPKYMQHSVGKQVKVGTFPSLKKHFCLCWHISSTRKEKHFDNLIFLKWTRSTKPTKLFPSLIVRRWSREKVIFALSSINQESKTLYIFIK